MATAADTTLREYLRLQRKKVPPCIDEYDTFLLQLWTFFELRSAAEDYYDKHRHLAKNRNAALPLPWTEIKRVLVENKTEPPVLPITRIAKNNFADVDELIRNLRKVLSRVREKVNIGRVQQIDSQCLRWLTRQPGRDAVEKAGARQEILAVVRVENYDTIENRVFKDFLQRCLDLSSLYIRVNGQKHEGRWKDHATLKMVARFRGLCAAGLSLEIMDSVAALHEMPQPNYVLQQDRLYSKIWKAYCTLLRQEDVADKLWKHRDELNDLYGKCTNGVSVHCLPRAKYQTNIWFNDIDGKRPILENPCWENELAESDIVEPELPHNEVAVVDFAAVWDERVELVYPKGHPNAYPYIKNPHHPSRDEINEEVSLHNILLQKDDKRLKDYLRSYYGLVGGREWIVLTPDNWDAAWIDKVRSAKPTALLSSKVFMLWRSVAAVLGLQDGQKRVAGHTIMVEDGYMFPFVNHCLIKYVCGAAGKGKERILPQRASKILHGKDCQDEERRFWLEQKHGDEKLDRELLRVGDERLHVGFGGAEENRHDILVNGAMCYVEARDRGKVCYFDELDPLWLVVQNRAEEVEFKPLIEHNECHPGGEEYVGRRINGGRLQMSNRKVSLNLLWGQESDTAKLKQIEKEFDEALKHDCDIDFEAKVTPGQGLATLMCFAEFLPEPKLLDLANMRESEYTKLRIEQEMERHFPPNMPYVEANETLWHQAEQELMPYLDRGRLTVVERGAFYKPRDYYYDSTALAVQPGLWHCAIQGRQFDEKTMSPIDRLKRENVFGNNPENSIPVADFDFDALFARLAKDYNAGRDVIRLMAWTYQTNNSLFEKARSDLYLRYVEHHDNLSAEETSFCSNNFRDGDVRISGLIAEALHRIVDGIHKDDDYRLVYNLLQFHPVAAQGLSSELCREAFCTIVKERFVEDAFYEYNRYGRRWGGKAATMRLGFMVKTLLFLLHRRRYDDAFLRVQKEWKPTGFFGQSIPHDSPAKATHDATREAVIAYVNGRGSLKGIPNC